ncbi:MAG: alpha/beta hydrolase [Firmicutes bacterium]|nr:alpha/beta hydrolase [Bacillota bacterium]
MANFTFKGKSVYYTTQGSGNPILLLNGIMMSTLSWKAFVPALSANNQLVLVDFLDQGQSDKMVGEIYTQEIQVALLVALLDHLKLEKVSVVGISYGGSVAMQFAVAHPERLARLVLFNATAYTTPWLSDIGKAWNKAAESGDGAAYYYTSIPSIYSPAYYAKKLDWMKNREKTLIPIFANPAFTGAMVRLTNSAETHDVRAKLSSITAPTLIVSSDCDYLTPMAEQVYLHDHIPNSDYIIIPGTGHASMYEKPLLFTTLVLGFVNVTQTTFVI